MILGAADFAEVRNSQPPKELVLALQAKQWGALPYPGGLYDQPGGLLNKMSTLYNVYTTMKSWRQRKPGTEKKWVQQNPDGWDIVQKIRKLRNG